MENVEENNRVIDNEAKVKKHYCRYCREKVSTTIGFSRSGMAVLKCTDCGDTIGDDYEDSDDYYEASFFNDFGDSN